MLRAETRSTLNARTERSNLELKGNLPQHVLNMSVVLKSISRFVANFTNNKSWQSVRLLQTWASEGFFPGCALGDFSWERPKMVKFVISHSMLIDAHGCKYCIPCSLTNLTAQLVESLQNSTS